MLLLSVGHIDSNQQQQQQLVVMAPPIAKSNSSGVAPFPISSSSSSNPLNVNNKGLLLRPPKKQSLHFYEESNNNNNNWVVKPLAHPHPNPQMQPQLSNVLQPPIYPIRKDPMLDRMNARAFSKYGGGGPVQYRRQRSPRVVPIKEVAARNLPDREKFLVNYPHIYNPDNTRAAYVGNHIASEPDNQIHNPPNKAKFSNPVVNNHAPSSENLLFDLSRYHNRADFEELQQAVKLLEKQKKVKSKTSMFPSLKGELLFFGSLRYMCY